MTNTVDLTDLTAHDSYSTVERSEIVKCFLQKTKDHTVTEQELESFMVFCGLNKFPWSLVSVTCNLSEMFIQKYIDHLDWNLIKGNPNIKLSDEFTMEMTLRGYVQ